MDFIITILGTVCGLLISNAFINYISKVRNKK